MDPKRVIVTGARGFVGRSTIVPLLRRGYEVHAFVTTNVPAIRSDIVTHRVDLLDTTAVSGALAAIEASHLLHTAWDVTHGRYWTSPANKVWLEAGKKMLLAFKDCGGTRAVGLGTCAEYDWRGDSAYHEAHTPLKPETPYGAAKLELGNTFARASDAAFSTAWARIFNPYGPGEKPQRFVPSVVCSLLGSRAVEMTNGSQIRDFLFVDDLGEALSALLDCSVSGAVNVASGQGVSLRQIAGKIAVMIGHGDLIKYGALPDRLGEPQTLVADVSRLLNEVGFHPLVDIESGLEASIAYWLSELQAQ